MFVGMASQWKILHHMNMLIVFQFYYKVWGLKVTEHSETVVQNRLNPIMHFQSSSLREWDLCFDTVASYAYTGHRSGAGCLVEQEPNKDLLFLACYCHVT